MDYRALNKVTVLDKYLILAGDELLDELYGAEFFFPKLVLSPVITTLECTVVITARQPSELIAATMNAWLCHLD